MAEDKTVGKKVTIVTHSSGFHTDDLFAVATLSLVLEKEGKEFEIIRSREEDVILKADYVVDVGGINDPDKNRFDHHQQGGAGKRENGIPYASFGLVWKKFGESLSGSHSSVSKIDKMLVQPIDANDNGVRFYETKIADLHAFDIGMLVDIFSPTYKEDDNIDDVFMKVAQYAKAMLARLIVYIADGLEAEQFVLDSYNQSPDKRVVVVNDKSPWNETLAKFPEPLFVIYKNKQDNWSIKGIRDDPFSYVYRKFLPKNWAGKRDLDLEKETGVEGAVFCHNHCFMAVAKTKEGALKMAEIALNS